MIRAKILFPLSFLFLSFLLLIFSALRMSAAQELDGGQNFSFSVAKEKEIYEASFSGSVGQVSWCYPGILPNNPFYWLKMIRDRVMVYITRNPRKRLEILLNYADKRLVAGEILIIEKEESLGVTTITKAEKYLQKAGIFAFDNLVENENKDLFEKVANKYLQHRQEIEKLLISDLVEDKKQILHNLSESSNVLFEDKFASYIEIEDEKEASSSAEKL